MAVPLVILLFLNYLLNVRDVKNYRLNLFPSLPVLFFLASQCEINKGGFPENLEPFALSMVSRKDNLSGLHFTTDFNLRPAGSCSSQMYRTVQTVQRKSLNAMRRAVNSMRGQGGGNNRPPLDVQKSAPPLAKNFIYFCSPPARRRR